MDLLLLVLMPSDYTRVSSYTWQMVELLSSHNCISWYIIYLSIHPSIHHLLVYLLSSVSVDNPNVAEYGGTIGQCLVSQHQSSGVCDHLRPRRNRRRQPLPEP
jgi:hypothetical protein